VLRPLFRRPAAATTRNADDASTGAGAAVTANAEDCGCAAFLKVDNLCGFPLGASGVTLLCHGSPCASIDPGNWAVAELRAQGTGPHEWSLRIQGTDGDHVAKVTFDVSSFDDGESCAVSSRRSSSSDLRWEVGVALALASCGLMRSSRRPRVASGAGRGSLGTVRFVGERGHGCTARTARARRQVGGHILPFGRTVS
jgi:hypothetical protein